MRLSERSAERYDLQGKSYTSKREGRKGGQFKEQGEEEEEKGKKHNTM